MICMERSLSKFPDDMNSLELWIHQRVVLPPRGTLTWWKDGLTGTLWSSASAKSCIQTETQEVFPDVSCLNIRKQCFTVWVTAPWKKLWSFPPQRYSEVIWMWCWASSSRWPGLAGKLAQITSRSPFQPQPPWDSVILLCLFVSLIPALF